MTFEQFENRVVLKADLIAITPIFIGAQTDSFKPGAVNGACVRDAYGRLYIPGASLKGVLRAFLAGVKNEPAESVVDAWFKDKSKREEYQSQHAAPNQLPQQILAAEVYRISTKVERLFGSKVMAGKVKVADAILKDGIVNTEVRSGVAINRDTHTANNGALFETEVVPSGTVFRFQVSAENLTAEEAGLFGKLMQYFAEGNISVGGRSRAGLGNVELRDVEITIYRKGSEGFPVKETTNCSENSIEEVCANVCQTNQ